MYYSYFCVKPVNISAHILLQHTVMYESFYLLCGAQSASFAASLSHYVADNKCSYFIVTLVMTLHVNVLLQMCGHVWGEVLIINWFFTSHL
jgi:hypothetical protein